MDADPVADAPSTDAEWLDLSGDGGVMKKVRERYDRLIENNASVHTDGARYGVTWYRTLCRFALL